MEGGRVQVGVAAGVCVPSLTVSEPFSNRHCSGFLQTFTKLCALSSVINLASSVSTFPWAGGEQHPYTPLCPGREHLP